MPARRDVPPPVLPQLQPRAVWEEAFRREFVRLRPHLQGLLRPLAAHALAALAQHGVDSNPKAAARANHQATAKR